MKTINQNNTATRNTSVPNLLRGTFESYRLIFVFLILFVLSFDSNAAQRTWSGGTSTDWNTASNWSGSAVPTSTDTVIIQTGTFNCVLAATTTIKQLTLTNDTLDLSGDTLKVTNNATTTAGLITNGTLAINGTGTATFNGGTIAVTLNVTAASIKFSGGTFSNAVTAIKKGSTNSTGGGGCTFSSTVSLIDSGSANWTFSNTTADTWNDKVTVKETSTGTILFAHHSSTANSFSKSVTLTNTSSGTIYCDYYANSTFHDSLIVNSTGTGDIYFGVGDGITTLDTSIILIGSSGFSSSGTLHLRGIAQNDATKATSLTLTGTVQIYLEELSTYHGTVTITAPVLRLNGSKFLAATTLIHNTSSSSGFASSGACYFGGTTTITKNASGSGSFTMGSATADTFATTTTLRNQAGGIFAIGNAIFNGKVTLKNEISGGSDRYQIATGGNCTFKDSVTLDNVTSGMTIGTGSGSATFTSASYIYIPSSFTGNLKVNNLTQSGSHAVNVPFLSNTGFLYLNAGNTFSGDFTFSGQHISLSGTTFNGAATILRTGTTSDTCAGGNVFNGTTIICDSASSQTFKMANTSADDFNGNVTFKQYGTGSHLYPAYNGNTTFGGNVTVDGSSAIEFGANGGKIIFDGGKGQSITKTGSYVPSFKRIEINSHNGVVSLVYPLTLVDSLKLVSGVLITDTTNLLTVDNNVIVSGGTDTSFIYGPVKKIGDDAFTFPLGDTSIVSGKYHPLGISAPTKTTAAYTARYFAQGQSYSSAKVDSIGYLSTCEYWTLNRNADTCQITPTLWWNTNSCNVDTSSQRIAYYNSTQWVSLGRGTLTGNPSKGSISSASNVNLFGAFILAQLCGVTADVTSSHGGTICAGVSDTINATPSGLTSYQFFKNGTSVQTGSSDKYISSSLANGDVIKVKATNVGGCFSYDSLTMVVNSLPSVCITTDSTSFCKGQTHTLTASGTGLTSYLWSGGATTSSRTVNAAGTYTVTVSNGTCSTSSSQVIALYDTIQPTIIPIGPTTVCSGTSTDLQASLAGAVNYLWSTTETTSLITVTDSATYQVTCLDAHGCYVHNWQVIAQASTPAAPIVTPTGIANLCSSDSGATNTSATLYTTNYSSHLLWSTSETTRDIVVDYEDIFNVIYTDSISGCFSISNNVYSIVSSNSILPSSITTNKTGNEICKGDSITLTENAGVLGSTIYLGDSTTPTYWAWYIGGCGDSLIGTGSSITVHPIEDTKYYLRAEGPCGSVCDTVMVYCMSMSMTAKNLTCPGFNNGIASVSVLGGSMPYSYHWSPRTGGSTSIWNLETGLYVVQVTDTLGCSLTDSIMVNNPDTISISIYVTSSDCHENSGTAKVVATGGVGTFNYFWPQLGLSNDSIGQLVSDIYQVIIADSIGCLVDTSVIVSDIDGPSVDLDSVSNVKCKGYDNGFVSIINEENPISLSFPCSVPGPQNLEAGVYPVLASDSNGCKTGLSITIYEPDLLDLFVSSSPSLCGDSIGTASVIVTGGTSPYTYKWSSGGTDSIEDNLSSGFDTLFITDFNGCESWKPVLITDSDGPILTTNSVNLSCFDSSYGQVFVAASGGIAPFNYSWYEIGQTDSLVDSLAAGTYQVLVTDSNGCKQSSSATISSPPRLELSIDTNYPTSDSLTDGSAAAFIQGGTPPYEYFWLPDSQTTRNISGIGNIDLAVTVMDSNGCATYKQAHSHGTTTVGCTVANYCNAPDDMPGCDFRNFTLPYPYGTTTLNIQDFGAVGDGVTNDECAFEFANYYINQLYNFYSSTLSPNAVVTLQFPPGTYIVGRQTFWGDVAWIPTWGASLPQECFYAKGHTIFALNDINGPNAGQINPLVIEGLPDTDGKYPAIKYADCLYYGAFEPDQPHQGERLLLNGSRDAYQCEIAFPGDLFDLRNSKDLTIRNLELNGNYNNFIIGGGTYHNDGGIGATVPHSGITLLGDAMTTGCSDILIKNVNIHHFGYAALQVGPANRVPNINLTLIDSKFNNNGCCGFAWEEGAFVRASNCQFNKNALEILETREASGIDIEPQGGQRPSHGLFSNCEFKYNRIAGVQSVSSFTNNFGSEEFFTFYKCTFVGSEYHPWVQESKYGGCIYMESPKVTFNCCSFYGFINRAWDEVTYDVNKTTFSNCSFNEEYYDPDEAKTYSFNTVCNVTDCNDLNQTGSDEGYLIQLSAIQFRRVTFNKCDFITNFASSFCTMFGSYGNLPDAIRIQNCHFYNHGLNEYVLAANCGSFQNNMGTTNKFFMYMFGVNFIGNNTLDYGRDEGCQFANGLGHRRHAGIADSDYKWGIVSSWKNWVSGCGIDQGHNDIHAYYWNSNCSAQVVVYPGPGVPPLDFSNLTIHDENYYWPCQERFENPTTMQIWSSSANIEYAYPPLCIFPPPPPPEDERLANQKNESIEKDLEVSPVPASDLITIFDLSKGENIYLYDLYGKEIFKINAVSSEVNIDIHALSNGVYFIKSSSSKSKKIIKIE